MKTFNDLGMNDKIYWAHSGSMQLKEEEIKSINHNEIAFSYSDKVKRTDRTCVVLHGDYHSVKHLFSNKSDAVRYCKAQMMKELFGKIDSAKKAIEEVKQFRLKNIELLNHEWTERKIIQLEKELGYL